MIWCAKGASRTRPRPAAFKAKAKVKATPPRGHGHSFCPRGIAEDEDSPRGLHPCKPTERIAITSYTGLSEVNVQVNWPGTLRWSRRSWNAESGPDNEPCVLDVGEASASDNQSRSRHRRRLGNTAVSENNSLATVQVVVMVVVNKKLSWCWQQARRV